MQLFLAAIFVLISVTTSARSAPDSRELLLIPVDSPLETQFTNPPITEDSESGDTIGHCIRKWEDFNFHRWLFPPKQPKQLDFFRLRASELPIFLSVRTLPGSSWQKSPNSILRNGELVPPESASVKSDYLVAEVLESQ